MIQRTLAVLTGLILLVGVPGSLMAKDGRGGSSKRGSVRSGGSHVRSGSSRGHVKSSRSSAGRSRGIAGSISRQIGSARRQIGSSRKAATSVRRPVGSNSHTGSSQGHVGSSRRQVRTPIIRTPTVRSHTNSDAHHRRADSSHDQHHRSSRSSFSLYIRPFLYGYGGFSRYDRGYGDSYSTTIIESPVVVREPYPENQPAPNAGVRYLADARVAFRNADYENTMRLLGHAAVELPENAEVHQLSSLALFALGDYQNAARAANVALNFGGPWDWTTLRGFYAADGQYTPQLRALENDTEKNPTAAHAFALVGYHYLMLGHSKAAERQLVKAAELNPQDELAGRLLKVMRGDAGSPQAPPAPPQETRSPAAPPRP